MKKFQRLKGASAPCNCLVRLVTNAVLPFPVVQHFVVRKTGKKVTRCSRIRPIGIAQCFALSLLFPINQGNTT